MSASSSNYWNYYYFMNMYCVHLSVDRCDAKFDDDGERIIYLQQLEVYANARRFNVRKRQDPAFSRPICHSRSGAVLWRFW